MMIADLLLRPDNRLLGGATGDFSLFGGQPTPGVTFGRESAADGHVSISAPDPSGTMSGAPASVGPAGGLPGGPVEGIPAAREDDAGALAGAATSPSPAAAIPDSNGSALDDLVPAALSSGGLVTAGLAALGLAHSIPMPPPATADAAPNPLAPAGASFDAPTLDQLVPQIGTLTTTVAPIADVVSGLVDAAAPVTQAVADDVIDPLASGVADVIDTTVTPVVAGVADSVAPVVAGVAAPVAATIADVATPVVDAVADTVSPVAAAVEPVTAPIVDAVQPAGAVLQPAADAVATVSGEALGGSDPEGGVQTLVGMVANADAFDVIAPGNAPTEEPSPSVIDDLIGDVSEVSPLLGDHDGANDDDGPDLFGGHGGLGLG